MSLFINNKDIETCLGFFQKLQIDSFNILFPDLYSAIKSADNAEKLGKDKIGTKYWDIANDLVYVNTYLMLVKHRIFADVSQGIKKTYSEYNDEFALDCIIKTFACNGIDIRPLYGTYGLLLDTYFLDGVNYMVIEPNVGQKPPFDII